MANQLSLYFLIQQANRRIARRIDTLLRSEGITAAQQLVMYTLFFHEPCSSAELARHARMTAQAMGEFIRGLESRGFVSRSPADSGNRAILLELTTEGKAVFGRCRRQIARSERDFLATLPEDIRSRFITELARLGVFEEGEEI